MAWSLAFHLKRVGSGRTQGFAKLPMYPSKAVDTVAKRLSKALEYSHILLKWTWRPAVRPGLWSRWKVPSPTFGCERADLMGEDRASRTFGRGRADSGEKVTKFMDALGKGVVAGVILTSDSE
jgi:hypothetical protein